MRRGYNRNAQYLGLFLIIILVLTMLFLLISGFLKTRDYVPVQAVLYEVDVEHGEDTDSQTTRHQYAYFRFEYEGIEWTAKRSALFFPKKDIGKTMTVRCDPKNPEILENTADRFLEIAILMIGLLSLVIVWRSIRES